MRWNELSTFLTKFDTYIQIVAYIHPAQVWYINFSQSFDGSDHVRLAFSKCNTYHLVWPLDTPTTLPPDQTTLTVETNLTTLITASTLTQDNNMRNLQKKYCWKLKSEEIAWQKDPEKQLVKSLLGRTICRKRTSNNNLHKWLIYFKKNLEHHLVEQVVRNNDLQKSYLKQKIANIWRKKSTTTTWENHLQKSCLERQFVKFLSI